MALIAYIDRERPTAAEMLAPTLLGSDPHLCAITDDGVAILALHGDEWEQEHFDLALVVHAALDRGLLVIA